MEHSLHVFLPLLINGNELCVKARSSTLAQAFNAQKRTHGPMRMNIGEERNMMSKSKTLTSLSSEGAGGEQGSSACSYAPRQEQWELGAYRRSLERKAAVLD